MDVDMSPSSSIGSAHMCTTDADCHGHGTCAHQVCECSPFWVQETHCADSYVSVIGEGYWVMVGVACALNLAVVVANLYICCRRRRPGGARSISGHEQQTLLSHSEGASTTPCLSWRGSVAVLTVAGCLLRIGGFFVPTTHLQDHTVYAVFTLLLRIPQIAWVGAYLCVVVVWFDMIAYLRRAATGMTKSTPPGQRLKLMVRVAVGLLVLVYAGIGTVNVSGLYNLSTNSDVPLGVYVLAMTVSGAVLTWRVVRALQYLTDTPPPPPAPLAVSPSPTGHLSSGSGAWGQNIPTWGTATVASADTAFSQAQDKAAALVLGEGAFATPPSHRRTSSASSASTPLYAHSPSANSAAPPPAPAPATLRALCSSLPRMACGADPLAQLLARIVLVTTMGVALSMALLGVVLAMAIAPYTSTENVTGYFVAQCLVFCVCEVGAGAFLTLAIWPAHKPGVLPPPPPVVPPPSRSPLSPPYLPPATSTPPSADRSRPIAVPLGLSPPPNSPPSAPVGTSLPSVPSSSTRQVGSASLHGTVRGGGRLTGLVLGHATAAGSQS